MVIVKFEQLRFLVLAVFLMPMLACALTGNQNDSNNMNGQGVDTSTWVAYVGRGVQVAAPPDGWIQVPFELPVALEQQEEMTQTDPTVAFVYRDLVLRYASKDNTNLVLMKVDGTAWMVIQQEALSGTDFTTRITAIQQSQRAQGTGIQNEQSITIDGKSAIRWEIAYSPPGSQIVNRQSMTIIDGGGTLYYMIFDAQSPDFDTYRPIFYSIADTALFAQ